MDAAQITSLLLTLADRVRDGGHGHLDAATGILDVCRSNFFRVVIERTSWRLTECRRQDARDIEAITAMAWAFAAILTRENDRSGYSQISDSIICSERGFDWAFAVIAASAVPVYENGEEIERLPRLADLVNPCWLTAWEDDAP